MQSYVRHALLCWEGDCSALFTSTHLDHNQFYQHRVIIYFELSSKSDWGHSQLKFVYSTCFVLSLFLFPIALLCKGHSGLANKPCCLVMPAHRPERLNVSTQISGLLNTYDWAWARGNQMQVMLFNQRGVPPYISWSLCPAKTNCRMMSMLSSAQVVL